MSASFDFEAPDHYTTGAIREPSRKEKVIIPVSLAVFSDILKFFCSHLKSKIGSSLPATFSTL